MISVDAFAGGHILMKREDCFIDHRISTRLETKPANRCNPALSFPASLIMANLLIRFVDVASPRITSPASSADRIHKVHPDYFVCRPVTAPSLVMEIDDVLEQESSQAGTRSSS